MVIQPVWRHGLLIEALAKHTFCGFCVSNSAVSVISPSMYCSHGVSGSPSNVAERCWSCSSKSAWTNHSSLALVSLSDASLSSSRESSVLQAVSTASAAALASTRFQIRICASLVSCVRARGGRGGGSEVMAPVVGRVGSGASGRGTGRPRRGRRPTCQARAAAATATMMITPCTVSRHVDSTPRTVSRVKSSSSAKAPAAAESTQPRPPPRRTPPSTTAVIAANS